MAHGIETGGGWRKTPWRIAGWGGIGVVLLLPLVAHAPWTLSDFLFMGALLGGAGLVLELAVRKSGSTADRLGLLVAVGAGVLLVWVNGAVGFIGDEDNPANLMFAGVLAVAVIGSALARLRPSGMARAMVATAAAQVLAGVVAAVAHLGAPGGRGLYEAALGTAFFTALWLIAAALFRKAEGVRAVR